MGNCYIARRGGMNQAQNDYISNGLIYICQNHNIDLNQYKSKITFNTPITINSGAYTYEYVLKVDSIPSGTYGRILDFHTSSSYGVSCKSAEIMSGSDFSINDMMFSEDFCWANDISLLYSNVYSLSFVMDNQVCSFYINGIKQIQTKSFNNSTITVENIYTMWARESSNRDTNGCLYSVRLYNRVLSDNEINYNYSVDQSLYINN